MDVEAHEPVELPAELRARIVDTFAAVVAWQESVMQRQEGHSDAEALGEVEANAFATLGLEVMPLVGSALLDENAKTVALHGGVALLVGQYLAGATDDTDAAAIEMTRLGNSSFGVCLRAQAVMMDQVGQHPAGHA